MTGSRVNVFGAALLFLATFWASAAEPGPSGPASAPPRGLTPAEKTPANTPADPALTTSAEEMVPDQIGKPAGPRVTVSGLSAIDPAGAGLIGPTSGGFAAKLWSGSPRAPVAARIAQLPAATNSPVMQSLTRRLLLTSAQPPQGVTPPDEPSFLAQRLLKIIANGWLEEAGILSGQSSSSDRFARQAGAEALLLQGREADACGEQTALRQSAGEAYWLKLRALCYIVQNELPAATLTLDVMRERQLEDDVFFALAEKLIEGGAAPKVAALPQPSGLHLALLHRARVAPPPQLVNWVPGTVLLSQATNPDIRLAAAERAAAASLLPVDQLRLIYEGQTFSADELDDPETAAAKLPAARANALYYQAIIKRALPAARAAAFAAALQRAEAQNRFALFARVAEPVAQRIQVSPQTAWLAPYIARVLLATGHDKAAEQWLAALDAPSDVPTVNALQVHLALVRPTTENVARLQTAMTWLGENALKPGGAKPWLMDRATREIPLLAALGYVVPPDAQWAMSATTAGVVPSGAAAEALVALARTSQEGRLGETVLNALVALGPGGPTRAQGQTVVRVVKALTAVGLHDEARAIAVETVLASPVTLRK